MLNVIEVGRAIEAVEGAANLLFEEKSTAFLFTYFFFVLQPNFVDNH